MPGDLPFTDPENLAVFTLKRIVRGESPILRVTHDDEDDGGWQFLDGGEVSVEEASLVSLRQMARLDPSILDLADLPLGWVSKAMTSGSSASPVVTTRSTSATPIGTTSVTTSSPCSASGPTGRAVSRRTPIIPSPFGHDSPCSPSSPAAATMGPEGVLQAKQNQALGPNTMGMYCTLTQIAEDELQQIRSDPKAVPPSMRRMGAASPPTTSQATPPRSSDRPIPTVRRVSLEKMWQALHFLLTGEPFGGTPPLSLAILGGHPVDEQEEGSNLVLEPTEVNAVATALSALTHEDLDRRFDPAKFEAAGIYPGVWDEDRGELLAELTGYFDELVAFYQDAARCENAMLIDIG